MIPLLFSSATLVPAIPTFGLAVVFLVETCRLLDAHGGGIDMLTISDLFLARALCAGHPVNPTSVDHLRTP